jgi:hypothetical protein
MIDPATDPAFEELHEVANAAPGTKIAPAHGIAAIALNMALKYHDINTVQDGELYQQYKLEGRNMHTLHLDHVFETAIRMEAHLIGGSKRIAGLLVDALEIIVTDEEEEARRQEEAKREPKPEEPKP